MTILLSDLSTASSTYIHEQVDVRIARVTSNLQRNEDGTFSIRITKASAPTGVRLTEVYLHITSSNENVALITVPNSALLTFRAGSHSSDPELPIGAEVQELFVFFQPDGAIEPDDSFDVGEVRELELPYHAVAAGTARFDAHIHASLALTDLFPDDRGEDGSKPVVVLT